MAGEAHAEPAPDGGDGLLECVVVKRVNLAAALVDDVMVVTFGVGDLVSSDPVASVQAM